MDSLMLLLFIPLAVPFAAKFIWHSTITFQEMGINCFVSVLLTVIVWGCGMYSKTADTEIWNGKITSKDRVHDTYLESYSCPPCHDVCSGSGENKSCTEVCSTCYRRHYTVTWKADSTVGGFVFEHLDETSKSVYNTKDPQRYNKCIVGEPASAERRYTNYIQGAPHSLFNTEGKVNASFAKQIPQYPKVYDFHRINRVISVGAKVPSQTITELNTRISESLRTLGPSKQANIIVILTEIDDPSFKYAVETAWLGGNKNDIVIFIGLDDHIITWADAMTWALNSGNEMFQVLMRDGILDIKTLDVNMLVPFIEKTVVSSYTRPKMAKYEYVKKDIHPSPWVIMIAFLVGLICSVWLTIHFHREDISFG